VLGRVKDFTGSNQSFELRRGGTMATAAADSDTMVKIGKMIFYITCAVSIWFFYWFAGIQCPC
jgi:hypothetical protein